MGTQRKKDDQTTKDNLASVKDAYKIELDNEKTLNDIADDYSRRVLRANNVTLIGGAFHYHIRSPTYGDPYDEVPWKVRMGMTETKERHGYPENPYVCTYEPRVLLNNWVEERRDRHFIKYNAPRLSQYGHHYLSETMRSFTKPLCNKQRDVLLNIATFPIVPHPGLQPELNVDTMRLSAPKPESCVEDEMIAKCEKEMRREKRYYKAAL